VAKVFDDDNLLWEIIVRVRLPTTLVRAALVCKRWLGHASDTKFLSCFRNLHPPRLLGYYITQVLDLLGVLDAPRFVPVLPQPPELATVMRRLESYSFGTKDIWDCRNGSLYTHSVEGTRWTHGVHRPLCAEKGIQIVPPLPPASDYAEKGMQTISKKEGSGLVLPACGLGVYRGGRQVHDARVYAGRRSLAHAYLGHMHIFAQQNPWSVTKSICQTPVVTTFFHWI
jgi:hypothetical protein